MFKLCLFRGCRIIFLLAVLFVVTTVVFFIASPDIGFLEKYTELKIEKKLNANKVNISDAKLGWQSGPSLELDIADLISDKLEIHQSHLTLSYPIFDIFMAKFSPEIKLSGGMLKLNFDIEQQSESSPIDATTVLDDVTLVWILNHEEQQFEHVVATLLPHASYIYLTATGVRFSANLGEGQSLQSFKLKLKSLSGLPKSWASHMSGFRYLELSAKQVGNSQWSWKIHSEANEGGLSFDDIHFELPFHQIKAEGYVTLDTESGVHLSLFDANKISWRDGENFGDFKAHWQDKKLHIDALDGSTSMPLLWSWLWMLGDDEWHDWLNSMHQGRVKNVRAKLDLDWKEPLKEAPTIQNLIDMKYHVVADGSRLDMALGLGGDFLYDLNGKVLIDQDHLEADVSHAVLKDHIATGHGKYSIDWHSLIMLIDAKGEGDVARLHEWLDKESATEIKWGKARATADLHMEWDTHKNEPNMTRVDLYPVGDWTLKPNNIPLTVSGGSAVWDYERGLDLTHMKVIMPWLKGDLSLFLDKNKAWSLQNLTLNGYAPLAELTEDFVLPVTHATGITKLTLSYADKTWKGKLDLSANDWDNFAGYDKEGIEDLVVPFTGTQLGEGLLPIQITSLNSGHDDFSFDTTILIKKNTLDFKFKNIDTSAFRGNLRLLMPLDEKLAWGLDVHAEYMNKPVLTRYLTERGGSNAFTRPWSVSADIDWVEWEKSYAQNVNLKFSSDKQGVGEVSADYLLSGDANLEQVKATFSLNGQGNYDLYLLEARGVGQLLQASGSVKVQKDGALKWQGLALMGGKFGTLMEQAELDKLFQEGEMSGVFIGKGEFKDGEPWWRKLKGSFKLRVDDGRINEGGTLTHLLAAISIVDLPKYLIFDRGDIVKSGLSYDKLQIEGAFDSNTLNIYKLGFLSSALDAGGKGEVDLETGTLDIVLVARPWQNIEVFLSKIPWLGHVLTGEDKSLKRAVYHIHGPASDAAVDEVNPEDVGLPQGGYLEDLFTPSKWFEPKKKVEVKEE